MWPYSMHLCLVRLQDSLLTVCFSYDANLCSSNNRGYYKTQLLHKTLHLLCISPSLIVFQLFGEQLHLQPQRRTGWDQPPAPTSWAMLCSRPPFTPGRSFPLTSTELPHYSPQDFPLWQCHWWKRSFLGMMRPLLTMLAYGTSLEPTHTLSSFSLGTRAPWSGDSLFVRYIAQCGHTSGYGPWLELVAPLKQQILLTWLPASLNRAFLGNQWQSCKTDYRSS